jgi:effector-binding domain-containing protein
MDKEVKIEEIEVEKLATLRHRGSFQNLNSCYGKIKKNG